MIDRSLMLEAQALRAAYVRSLVQSARTALRDAFARLFHTAGTPAHR